MIFNMKKKEFEAYDPHIHFVDMSVRSNISVQEIPENELYIHIDSKYVCWGKDIKFQMGKLENN